jgi:hypothetical protein
MASFLMESIINNFQDPSWWFTGLFFISILYVVKKSSFFIPKLLKGYFRKKSLKTLQSIRLKRSSNASINYEIIKAHSYFLIFLATCGIYLFWYTSTSMSVVIKDQPLAAAILILPIYVTEVLWLLKDRYAQKLVNAHNKLLKSEKLQLAIASRL